ncbi:hypothetical protein [Streptomyces sp. NPDC001380]|uniref:hypothetical protein n=1 Tax=Streptomyces sp. NPDC001380 TaxID=3364566 RepID=UPI00368221CD
MNEAGARRHADPLDGAGPDGTDLPGGDGAAAVRADRGAAPGAVAEDGGSGLPDTVEDLTDAVEQAADRLGRRRTLLAAAAVVGAAGVGATVVRIVAARRHPWRTRLHGLLR